MPVKRRASKRRTNAALLEAWSATFEFGHDYFGDLQRLLGIDEHGPLARSNEESAKARAAFIELAREAWEQLGAAYLAQPSGSVGQPWALEQFGEP